MNIKPFRNCQRRQLSVQAGYYLSTHYIQADRLNFFVAKEHLFLPLLPEGNHVQRLIAQRQQSEKTEENLSVYYKIIEH